MGTLSGPKRNLKCQQHPKKFKKMVLHNARERTLGARLAIYLVYRAPADKLTKAENTITIFKLPSGWCFMSCKPDFCIIFSFS